MDLKGRFWLSGLDSAFWLYKTWYLPLALYALDCLFFWLWIFCSLFCTLDFWIFGPESVELCKDCLWRGFGTLLGFWFLDCGWPALIASVIIVSCVWCVSVLRLPGFSNSVLSLPQPLHQRLRRNQHWVPLSCPHGRLHHLLHLFPISTYLHTTSKQREFNGSTYLPHKKCRSGSSLILTCLLQVTGWSATQWAGGLLQPFSPLPLLLLVFIKSFKPTLWCLAFLLGPLEPYIPYIHRDVFGVN